MRNPVEVRALNLAPKKNTSAWEEVVFADDHEMASAEEFRALAFSSAHLAFRKYHMKAVSGDSDLNS